MRNLPENRGLSEKLRRRSKSTRAIGARVLLSLLLIAPRPTAAAAALRILSETDDGLLLELELPAPRLAQVEIDGRLWDQLRLPGFAREARSGYPDLPFLARLVAVPPGARIAVDVVVAEWTEQREVELIPVAEYPPDASAPPTYAPAPEAYARDLFLPAEPALATYSGVLRGTAAHALRIHPFQYNPARRILRACTRLRLRVRFVGGRRPRAALESAAARDAALFGAFLNPARAASWPSRDRAPKIAAADWYDPALPWIKLHIDEDGLYCIDPDWLRRYADPAAIDPRTFRLFYLGEEQVLLAQGQEDGRFDAQDCLIFPGRFRRDDRDFGSLYGPRDTYWLTWGGALGQRFAERSGAPLAGYPEQRSFWTTAHAEVDAQYDPLIDVPDIERDHWFWDRVDGTHPTKPGSGVFPGVLLHPDLDQEYAARVRVVLYGLTWKHHTVVKLSTGHVVADTIWEAREDGLNELLVDAQVPAAALRDSINRVVVQAYADQDKFDWVYMNWFEIDYLRRYRAADGYLESPQAPSDGHRIAVSGLRDTRVELLDTVRHIRFTDLQIDSIQKQVQVTFEDRSPAATRYVIADSQALKTPRGELDTLSAWRRPGNRADYLIIAPPSLLSQARELADHRRAAGLEVEVVSVKDLYDEFSHGRVDRRAIADFIRYAYHQWARRPAYVLLLGDDTYDYRGILGGVPAVVPALYYQSRGRGEAPSDFLYTLVDGDDLLPDLAIGRLAASSGKEARQIVDKVIRYDREPEPGDWRSRVIYLANYHPQNTFTGPSDSLAARYTEPWGLTSVKVYNPDDSPFPNVTGRAFLDAINHGAVLLNFNGHGSAGTLQYVFSLASSILTEWDYLSQVRNGGRLPLVLALSCLNGMFVNPREESLGEVFTTMEGGGAIAYVSASAKSFPSQNDLLSDFMYERFFERQERAFGPVLNAAKSQILAAHPEIGSGWEEAALTMQLFGDPAQELALPFEPDYVAHDLHLTDEEVFGHATVQVNAELRNRGRRTADSLQAVVLGYAAGAPQPDTLYTTIQPPFSGPVDLSFAWSTGPRRGPYRLELRVDPEDRIAELDEQNNLLTLDLKILEPLSAAPVFPAPGATIGTQDLRLQAAVPLEGGPYSCEFSLSFTPDFPADGTLVSAPIPAVDGAASYPLDAIDPGFSLYWRPYFWRVRLHSPGAVGPWSPPRTFRFSPTAESSTWRQEGIQMFAAVSDSLVLEEGELTLSPEPLPFRPSSATREDRFTVRGLSGAGVLCTDGTFVYAKRWYNDNSTVYPGDDFFTRVGTGYGDYHRTGHYGQLSDSTTAGISATYHRDGYIYSESGRAYELERLSVATGELDTVAVPAGLLEWKSGQIKDGHSLITSDGRFIYNVSMSSEKGARTEWGVRVFDPARNWTLMRQFTSPPTDNGFTFQWTDGILADGRRLYLIEYGGQRRIRMIDAFDGHFLDEWTSDQDTTRIISGQYDWVNNKVWLGDLFGSAVFRYAGVGYVDSAAALSEPIGPAARWERLRFDGEVADSGRLEVDLLVREGEGWTPHPDFTGLSPGTAIDLSRLDAAAHPQIRLQARLRGGHPNTRLRSWSVDFVPRPSLRLSRAEGQRSGSGLQVDLQVRNLSAFTVDDARLLLERSDQDAPLREHPLAPLAPGETRPVLLDSLEIPPSGARLFARVESGHPDAEPADDQREVLLFFGGRTPLVFQSWPDGRAFLSGDPLQPGQGLIVAAPGVPGGNLELTVDGDPVAPDSTLDAFPDTGPRLLYRPQLPPGRHTLQARLVRDGEELGLRELVFQLGDRLTLANILVYPHPVRDRTAFTYVLSHDAEVGVEIFALSGRLVRRLGPVAQTAGFQQLAWDGRDADGRLLAGGAYLYLLRARRNAEESVHRGPLAIVR